MIRRIEAGLMKRVQALLNTRQELPGQQAKGPRTPEPKLQVSVEGDVTDLLIYDEISWFGICAQDVADALDGVTGALNVRINSPGGDVFDGVAIYNMLADYDGQVTVTVDGLAASAASFITMAGDTIRMNRASQMMIHDAMTMVYGNAAYMTEVADLLDRLSDTIAGIYADRTGVDAADWRTQMRAETWYNADEAVKAGLATETAPARRRQSEQGDEEAAPAAAFDLSVFTYAGRSAAPAPPLAISWPLDVASAVHHTAVDNSAWDGPGAVSAMPAEAATLKYCHAWREADGDPDAKASYKFPHHRKDGGPANLAACRNGLARLSSADIPDGDRAGVEAHLRAHLKDGGGEDLPSREVVDETGGPDPVEAGADPAAADPTPADPTPDPDPDPVAPQAAPDDWAAATAHLTTSPDDEWARLREALL